MTKLKRIHINNTTYTDSNTSLVQALFDKNILEYVVLTTDGDNNMARAGTISKNIKHLRYFHLDNTRKPVKLNINVT